VHSMRMFGQLLSAQLQREAARVAASEREQERDAVLGAAGGVPRDPATGLLTRAGAATWLRSVVPGLRPGVEQLALAWVDVVPVAGAPAPPEGWQTRFADVVRGVGRAGDLRARVGESFVVGSVLPGTEASVGSWRDRLAYVAGTAAGPHLRVAIGVATTDDPAADPDALLQRAGAAAR
jgi:hypothetical protein